jgi:hypothetical protein
VADDTAALGAVELPAQEALDLVPAEVNLARRCHH